MARLRANFKSGTVTDSPLGSGATTINSPELAGLPVVSSPDYMPLALDPEGLHGAPEIVWVTDHASGASSVTVTRHQEGTLARSHPSPTVWANTLTAQDINEMYAAVDSVATALPGYLPLAGGTLTGLLTLSGAPTANLHAATKKYVDDKVGTSAYLPLTGGTLTGFLTLHANPTNSLHAVTKGYVDVNFADEDHNHAGEYAPPHSHPYAATSHSHSVYVQVAGDTITGAFAWSSMGSAAAPVLRGTDTNSGIYFGGATFAMAVTANGTPQFIVYPDHIEMRDNLEITSHLQATGGYWTAPLSTSNNGLPSWRHDTAAASLGWEQMRLVSSARYKRNMIVADADRLVDELRQAAGKLISWEDKGSPKGSPRYMGISAEDAYAIVPHAVALDEKGRPESVDPSNAFSVHLIAAVGQLLDRMDAVELAAGI